MSTTTTNLNMVLNEGQDKFSIPTLNENLTKIDTAIGEQNKKIEIKALECIKLHDNVSYFYVAAIAVNNVVIINGSISLIGDIKDTEPVFSINSRLFKSRTFGQTVNNNQSVGALYGEPNTPTVKAWGNIQNGKNYTFLIVGELVEE